MKEILEDPLLNKFFRKRRQKESTRKIYAYHFLNYYKATGLTPTMAIEEAKEDQKTIPFPSERRIDDHQIEYIEYLEGKKASQSSIRQGLTMIRTFFKINDIVLPSPPVTGNDEEDDSILDTTEELPDLEDIKKAFMKATPLYQSIIVLMASSGMGRGEIIRLTIQHLLDALNTLSEDTEYTLEDLHDIPRLRKKLPKPIPPLKWTVKRAKLRSKSKAYITFSTPESLDYLLRYMELARPIPMSNDEKLYLNRNGDPVREPGFDDYFWSLNRRCGWSLNGKQAYFRSHNIRKWFTNQLVNTTLGFNNTNWMLGHQPLKKTEASYMKPKPEVMKSLYYDNMDAVTLFSKVEVHDKTDETVKELTKKVELIEKEKEDVQREKEEIRKEKEKIKRDMAIIEEFMKKIEAQQKS